MENPTRHVSAVQRLPCELLSEIFLHCAGGGVDAVSTIRMPLLTTQICKEWRAIAISTPSLWCRLFLSINERQVASHSELAATLLARSGLCPLTIYIFWEEHPYTSSHPVLDIIAQHSHHWYNMLLFLPMRAFPAFSAIKGCLPLLTELTLGTEDDIFPYPLLLDPALEMFESAPQLRCFESINLSPHVFRLPWAQLRRCPMMSAAVDECIDVLRRSPNLEECRFICLCRSFSTPHPLVPVQLSHLRSISIMIPTWNPYVDVNDLFEHLTSPLLRSLEIYDLQSTLGPQFFSFLSRSPDIERLGLRRTSLTDEDVIQCLRAVPSLIHLDIEEQRPGLTINHNLMSQLTYRRPSSEDGGSPYLAPMLTSIRLRHDNHDTTIDQVIVDMIQSRWTLDGTAGSRAQVMRLQSVLFVTIHPINPQIMSLVDVFKTEGLDIEMERVIKLQN
jgi:hypothetical protein